MSSTIDARPEDPLAAAADGERASLFRVLVEHIDMVFYASSPDQGVLEYVSPAFERIWGMTCESLYANPRRYMDAILPEYRAMVEQAAIDQERGIVTPIEYEIERPDGTRRWINDVSYPVRAADGHVERIVGFAKDVTDRRQAEEALRGSEERLKEAQAVAKVGSWVLDARTDLLEWSDECYRLFALPKGSIVRMTDFWSRIPEEDVPRVKAAWNAAAAGVAPYDVEHRANTPEGLRWIRERATLRRDSQGAIMEVVGTAQDVTDIRDSEQRLALALDAGSLMAWEWRPLDGTLSRIGGARDLGNLAGGVHELRAVQWLDVTHPEYVHTVDAAMKDLLKGTVTRMQFEYRHRDPAGKDLWVRTSAQVAERRADGKVVRVIGTTHDITERKNEALKLAAEQARLAIALESGELSIWEWDASSGETLHDPRFREMLGHPAAASREAEGEWRTVAHPDDIGPTEAAWHAFLSSGSARFNFQFRLSHRRGHWVWIESTGQAVARAGDGRPLRVIGTYRDITARKQGELELATQDTLLKAVQSGAGLGFAVHDLASGTTAWSPQLFRLLGYSEGSVAPSADLLVQRLHPDDREEFLRLDPASSAARGVDVVDSESRLVVPKQGTRWVSWRRITQRDALGRPARIVTVLLDVSDRKRTRDFQLQAQKMEAMSRLAAGMAHDFNNLLAIIVGNLDLLRKDGRLGEDEAALADTALSAALRGADVTRSLVTMAGERPYEEQTFDLAARLGELMPLIRHSAGPKVVVAESLEPGALQVCCDASGLDTALINLVVNARDAMPSGGNLGIVLRRRTLSTADAAARGVPAAGDYAEILVSDSGTGMPADVLARAFDPFFTTKERGRGTGLGLPLVHGFMRQLGGSIDVESREGTGTVVTLLLPLLAAGRRPGTPVEAPAACDSAGALVPPARVRVLLVEDEKPLRTLATTILSQAGYPVAAEADAAAARKQLIAEDYEVMLCDLVMPGDMDGLALARWAAEHRPEMAVVIVTGLADQVKGLSGPWEVLRKPYRPAQLLAAIEKAAQRRGG